MAAADVHAVFPAASRRAGLYESFYLRAVAPDRPLGAWLRYTVHRRAGRAAEPPRGSLWCTVFDGAAPPFMHKLTVDGPAVADGEWLVIGGARIGPGHAEGACGGARWSLRFHSHEPELRHLPRELLYRLPLPRTKLTSPMPAARFEGTLELPPPAGGAPPPLAPAPASTAPPGAPAGRTLRLDGWHGMVGHNWGAEHAERWIWLHGTCFEGEPDAWLDVALGRVRLAGRTTPWVANGALCLDGERHRLGGLGARGLLVAERPERCLLTLPGADGLVLEAHVQTPPAALAGWRYGDPDGGEHDVSNCSIAGLTLAVRRPGHPARTLRTAHGAAYELGMREHDHGVPLAPFADG